MRRRRKLDSVRVLLGTGACQDLLRGLGYSPAEGYAVALYLAESLRITAPSAEALSDLEKAKAEVEKMTWRAAVKRASQ